MKKIYYIMAILAVCGVIGCRRSVDKANAADSPDARPTLLQLFYGMSTDSDGNYCDSILDTVPGLLHREFQDIWYNTEDSTSFKMSIGVYIDRDFPTPDIREIILEKTDSLMAVGMYGDLPSEAKISLMSQGVDVPDTVSTFLKLWQDNFDHWTTVFNSGYGGADYAEIIGPRGCTVAHKVYEDAEYATYILEISYDCHGTCGCPSNADYITIAKETGHIFTKSDFMEMMDEATVEETLVKEYIVEKSKRGISPEPAVSWSRLLESADGVAIINEGILIYFHPYNLGGGSEGQYNFILPASMK